MAAMRALMSKLPRSLRRSRPLSALSNPQPPPSIRRFYTTPPQSETPPPLPETSATRTWTTAPRITMFPDEDTDFEHWVVVMDFPDPNISPDQKIQAFISTLAQVVGSEEEAKMKIYSMSLKHIIAFGARIPVDLTHKIRELPNVGRVLPDSYVDEENKVFGMLDIAYKDEEWEKNNRRSRECTMAERMIRRIRLILHTRMRNGRKITGVAANVLWRKE